MPATLSDNGIMDGFRMCRDLFGSFHVYVYVPCKCPVCCRNADVTRFLNNLRIRDLFINIFVVSWKRMVSKDFDDFKYDHQFFSSGDGHALKMLGSILLSCMRMHSRMFAVRSKRFRLLRL